MFSPLLLLLGLLGFVGCHSASDQNPRGFEAGMLSSDGSEIIVEAFLDAFRLAIVDSDQETIDGLVADDFVYKGCKSDYNKATTTEYLVSLPKSDVLSFQHQSSRYVGEDATVEFTMIASIHGAERSGKFVVQNIRGRNVLLSGTSLDCSDPQIDAIAAVFTSLTRAINLTDLAAIGAVFTNEFQFEMCDYPVSKDTIVEFFGGTAIECIFEILSHSSSSFSGHVTARVVLSSSSGNFSIDADYLLKKKNGVYQVAHGKIHDCS